MPELTAVANDNTCQACGDASIEGLQHCVHCGAQMPDKSKSAGSLVQTCSKCGRADKNSFAFCAFCGDKFADPADSEAPKQTYRWTKPSQRRRYAKTNQQNSKSNSSLARGVLLTGAIAAILITVAYKTDCLTFLKPAQEHLSWHGHSVVVYVKPSGAQISLKSGGTQITSAKVPEDGKASFAGLSPGKYLVIVEATGLRSAFGTITVNPDAPSVIGYPQPIELTPAKQ
jgi:hypothetical protein